MKTMQWVGLLLLTVCSHWAKADTVYVAVAANFSRTMQTLVAEFERISSHKVILSFGSSGKFYAQIKHGAPYQLFFSADQAKPQALQDEGLIVADSRFTYAIGRLALWSAKPEFKSDLETRLIAGEFSKLALANPKLAPYGAASIAVLQYLNLIDSTRAKWVQGENIAQTYQFVSTANADMGFVALSQLFAYKEQSLQAGKDFWLVPQTMYRMIKQDAVWLKQVENSQAASEFLDFVRSDKALQIITQYGYAVREKSNKGTDI